MNDITRIHEVWNRATGQNIPMGVCSYELEHGWHQFLKAGYTEADLLAVVGYLQGEIKKGERKPAALRWRNCAGDALRFAEELQLARGAVRRNPPAPPRERALRELRPSAVPDGQITARPVSELIANLRRAAGMTP